MADTGGPLSKRVQGEGSEKVGYKKSDMVNKFRDDVRVLPDWDIDKSDANLMMCIEVVFKYRFREFKFDVQHDPEWHKVAGPAEY
ncbi:hypothetical protein D8674_039166 [Pyrus ussuriensis x Pyrus communis]|uniref:Uncharacterized protein n=1 Tax=Pyrus ussuriensis x Pyrus communis TaxID=2448454 RepID=A0A5N5I4E4_9ROSA|nr:hypothetical protein D8674_039206 [Pyrus ussuriensis x Pyrus communis]KAB2634550.1 hypothetical protein D8674_039166 [Pyrus ussuriensis x Pyrus communis]